MRSQKLTGGGGVQLSVIETGNPKGRPIVFIHGFHRRHHEARQRGSDGDAHSACASFATGCNCLDGSTLDHDHRAYNRRGLIMIIVRTRLHEMPSDAS